MPDVVAFGKKMQVCGVMAGGRVDDEPENVFVVGSRINSTWGGNLTDMVRARRVLEVIEAGRPGRQRGGPRARTCSPGWSGCGRSTPALVADVRGRGLMCAFTMPTAQARDALVEPAAGPRRRCWCSAAAPARVRFRPALCVTDAELDEGLAALDRVLASLAVDHSDRPLVTSGSNA